MLEILKIIRVIGVLGFAIVMTLLAIRLEQRLCRRDFRLPIRLSPVIKWYHPFAFLGLTLALAQFVRMIIEKAQPLPEIAVAPAEPGFPSSSFMLAEGLLRIAISLILIWRFSLLWPTAATAARDRIKFVGWSIYLAVKMLLIWVPCVMGAVLIARLDQGADNPHILFQMLKSATSFDLLAIYVTVALVAPISEELLFRGLLQGAIIHTKYLSWLHRYLRQAEGTDAERTSITTAPQEVELNSDLRSQEAESIDPSKGLAEADQSPAQDAMSEAKESGTWISAPENEPASQARLRLVMFQAVTISAILFGLVHSTSWPDPIPLAVLGVAFSRAYLRSQSLLTPIFMHAIFNAVNLTAAIAFQKQ